MNLVLRLFCQLCKNRQICGQGTDKDFECSEFFMTSKETVKKTLSSVCFIKSTESTKHFGFSLSILYVFDPALQRAACPESTSQLIVSEGGLTQNKSLTLCHSWSLTVLHLVSSASVLVASCVVGLSCGLLPVSRCVSSHSSSAASDWSASPSLVPPGSPVFAVTSVLRAAHFLSVCLCDVLPICTDK